MFGKIAPRFYHFIATDTRCHSGAQRQNLVATRSRMTTAKSFGHRSKTAHCAVFSLRSIPLILYPCKNKRGTLSCTSFIFGGPEGNRTPVRKPLDMTFSVGSQFLLFPTMRRQLTGNTQSVAPLCLIGSGATTDASSPLRSRSVRSRGPLRRNG